MFKTQGLFIVVVVFLFVSTVPLGVVGQKSVVCVENEMSSFNSKEIYTYFGDCDLVFLKELRSERVWYDVGYRYHSDSFLNFINLSVVDEAVLRFHVNCSVSMNYSVGFPFVFFAPVAVIGFMVENYSDYHWVSTRLKNDGIANWSDEIVFDVPLDLENPVVDVFNPLTVHLAVFRDPMLVMNSSSIHSLFFRLCFFLRNADSGFFYDVLLPSLMDSHTTDVFSGGAYMFHY